MYAIIMAGGSGTRFWPLSREKMPKQLLKIGGEDTLIRQTVSRMLPLVRIDDIFIVTNNALAESIGYQLSSGFNRSWDGNFILEPEARNTAPALGLAALHLERVDPESVMVVLAADHFIRKADLFLDLLGKAGSGSRAGLPRHPGHQAGPAGDRVRVYTVGRALPGRRASTASARSGPLSKSRTWKRPRNISRTAAITGTAAYSSGRPERSWPRSRSIIRRLHQGLNEIRKHIGTDRETDVGQGRVQKAGTDLHRLCRDGKDRPGRDDPRRYRLVRCGQLDRTGRRFRPRRCGQRHKRQCDRCGQPQLHRLCREAAGRDHRPERYRRRRHARCHPHLQQGPGPGRQEGRGRAQKDARPRNT